MPKTPGHPELNWVRSSRCEHANCVEVAFADGSVFVRDSKRSDDTRLRFSGKAWLAFVAAIKSGEFGA